MIAAGFYLESFRMPAPWFIFLNGAPPVGFLMIDYFPWLHSLGYVLLGLEIGRRGVHWSFSPPQALGRFLRFLGRHSLAIYLIHQPLLIGLFYLWGR